MTTTIIPTFTLGDRLHKARQITGLSQEDFGRQLGVSGMTVKRYELGYTTPRRALVLGWAVAAGVDPAWLEHGTDTGTTTTEYLPAA